MGDPFYLFDNKVEPYKYMIRIIVTRPSEKGTFYNENDSENNQGKLSYISGFYVISNIKHSISESGFSTILEIIKWPSIYDIPVGEEPNTISTNYNPGFDT
jgi:hypothetical protein